MLDGLLGRGSSSKCKSLIAKLMNRTDILKRKKRAVIGYLKKDIADLLQNGFDTNAYGRVDGLIAEVNRGCSYELIEKFCNCILSQLSLIQKQRDCPEESKEAVATVMFAAARFADLPELSDLRGIFTEKYGDALESFVNQEFVDRIALKPPSIDQKLELMQIIASEFSINWDVKRFKVKISNPSTIPGDRQTKHGPTTDCKGDAKEEKEEVVFYAREFSRRPSRKDKPNLHERQSSLSRIRVEVNAGPVYTTKKEVESERRDAHERERLSSHGRERAESSPRAKFTNRPEFNKDNGNHHRVTGDDKNVTALNASAFGASMENVKPTYSNNALPPPYIKPDGPKYKSKLEVQHTGSDDIGCMSPSKQMSEKSLSKQWSEKSLRGPNPIHVEREMSRLPSNFVNHGDDYDIEQDNVLLDAHPRPKSVRRKHKKPPTVEDGSPGVRESVVEEKNGTRVGRGGQTTFNVRKVDEEEEMMDELLLHYSKKGSSTSSDSHKKAEGLKAVLPDNDKAPYSRNRGGETVRPESIRVPARAISFPAQPVTQVRKVPARVASFEPDGCSPRGVHVHPKLPDYDDLAARFAALKGGKKF